MRQKSIKPCSPAYIEGLFIEVVMDKRANSHIVKYRRIIINALEDNKTYQFRYSISRSKKGVKSESNLSLKIAALQLQAEKEIRILNKRPFCSDGISGINFTIVREYSKKIDKSKLINVNEVAELIGRHQSTVDKYVAAKLIPGYVRKDKVTNSRYWDKQKVIDCLPKIVEYQGLTTGQRPQGPKGKKNSIEQGYIPPLTTAQQAINNAFNLCVNN